MERTQKKILCKRLEDLSTESVVNVLEQCNLDEFVDFVKEKELDGRKLMNVTEGIVKMWKPRCNANKFILFIQDFKSNPEKYLSNSLTIPDNMNITQKTKMSKDEITVDVQNKVTETIYTQKEIKTVQMTEIDLTPKLSIEAIESQYQTVKKTKNNNFTAFDNVEELIKKIVPAKSFLYRNQGSKEVTPSYLPMDSGTPKTRKNIFRISGYDYPKFDLRRFSKQDSGDRGYYPMKRNSRFFVQKSKPPESDARPKCKSLSSTEELKYPEDHFYEDLCYNEVENVARNSVPIPTQNVKPYKVKIQELFQSFKMPFFKKNEEVIDEESDKRVEVPVDEKEVNYYENSESNANMYDSVHVNAQVEEPVTSKEKPKLPVEDYLEPVQLSKDYCDVKYHGPRSRDDTLLGYIMSVFENRFGYHRETHSAHTSDSEDEKTAADRRWSEDKKTNMADRPLPVPVENEPYYMDIDRKEAENLLRGQLDGTFVLRPSSQPNHAYTISVCCNSVVHNVAVRRRADGRLALGRGGRGERGFADVTELLAHHRKRRLLLVANGTVIGATTLNETPQYYQTPCSIPVKVHL